MPGISRVFGLSVLSFAVVLMCTGGYAATGRDGYANVRATTVGGAAASRMPTMPTLPIHAVGNISQNVPTTAPMPSIPDVPDVPDVPDIPDEPDNPDIPDEPDIPDNPPVPECPDGGVKNSAYTVEMCMDDVLRCVNYGALPDGLNDMFDENTRNAIINGMGLCVPQVQKCIAQVRVDCDNVYRSAPDVWIDFNSRRVQPEYYKFVLRKTGLTPNQAETVCAMLDKNTSGASFDASAVMSTSVGQEKIAYNAKQGNILVKNKTAGTAVGGGILGDNGARGNYARWDAKNATCYIRVAAYNKDKHITNTWLFGAMGDDQPAEVWRAAGDSFTCNKDLFGFSLMNDTHTAAVVGVGGGALVGAGVGAIAGHGARDFDCSRDNHRTELGRELRASGQIRQLNQYLEPMYQLSLTDEVTMDQCVAVVDLFNKYQEIQTAIDECDKYTITENKIVMEFDIEQSETQTVEVSVRNGQPVLDATEIARIQQQLSCDNNKCSADDLVAQVQAAFEAQNNGKCRFKPINLAKMRGESIFCNAQTGCIYHDELARDARPLGDILDGIKILKGEKSNMAKSIGVGAAVGAGAGGLATAITAYVEHNNINCRVADNLNQVSLGKSHVIDTLRDFYVKWNLNLPDTVTPTATVDTCKSWRETCARFSDLNQCANAQFNYKPAGAAAVTLVHSACVPSGSVCLENQTVAKSYGACE